MAQEQTQAEMKAARWKVIQDADTIKSDLENLNGAKTAEAAAEAKAVADGVLKE